MHTANIEFREGVKNTYKRLKTMGNHLTFMPKTWSQSLIGGGCLLEVPTVSL